MPELRHDLHVAAGRTVGEVDPLRIRRRSDRLRRRRAVAVSAVPVLAVLGLVLGLQAARGDGSRVRTEQPDPRSTPTASEAPVAPGPGTGRTPGRNSPTTASTPPVTTVEPATARRTELPGRQRILEDPRGDARGDPPAGRSKPSLDLLALDLLYDGRAITFVHVLEGSPSEPPPGATGREHLTYFRIPGHNLVSIRAVTDGRERSVDIGVIQPGKGVGEGVPAERCDACDAAFDGATREVRVTVPVADLNDMLRRAGGGELRSGVEVGGWEAYTGQHTDGPLFHSGYTVDVAKRFDVFWRVP